MVGDGIISDKKYNKVSRNGTRESLRVYSEREMALQSKYGE